MESLNTYYSYAPVFCHPVDIHSAFDSGQRYQYDT